MFALYPNKYAFNAKGFGILVDLPALIASWSSSSGVKFSIITPFVIKLLPLVFSLTASVDASNCSSCTIYAFATIPNYAGNV